MVQNDHIQSTRALVVMGVAGCGKSTLAASLAEILGWTFIEGDLLHPASNREKMAAGIPLTDQDREPFLANVATSLADQPAGAVAACSALKRAYRDAIRDRVGDVLFILPDVPEQTLHDRMLSRKGHFMPVSLLQSQLTTLEPLADDENAITLDGLLPLPDQLATVLRAIAPAA